MVDDSLFYSEHGEDFLLWQLLGDMADGFYIDIGANDGIYHNNSFYFEEHGWKGICLESDTGSYSLCKNNRPNALCINPRQGGSHNIDARGLKEILQEHLPKTKRVNFISINLDSYGVKLELLAALSLQEWFTDVVVIKSKDYGVAKQAAQSMHGSKYTLSRILPNSYLFSRHEYMIEFLKYKKVSCKLLCHAPQGDRKAGAGKRRLKTRKTNDAARWITPTTLCQSSSQPLWSLLDDFPEHFNTNSRKVRLVHVVNPYPSAANTVSGRHQQLTYESMHAAREFDRGNISLVSIQHKDDPDLTPKEFERGRFLERTVTDVAEFRKPHPLPLLFDILERGAELAENDDYIIYTNSDIILMPHFYSAVKEFIGYGFDAISICRRTIGEHAFYLDHTNMARSEVGGSHPGSDCFIFSKKAYNNFVRNHACIGRKLVARSLLYNMAATSKKFLILKNVSLTYHIGDDRVWNYPDTDDYTNFNRNELTKACQQLAKNLKTRIPLEAYIKAYWQ